MSAASPTLGDEIPTFVVESVSAENMKLMALLLRDPNPIHFDLDAVASAGLGSRVVNQGGTTLAYVYNMLEAWAGPEGAVRRVGCRFRGNVFAGDHVTAGGVVTCVRILPDCDVWVERADGVRVITGTATVGLPAPATREATT